LPRRTLSSLATAALLLAAPALLGGCSSLHGLHGTGDTGYVNLDDKEFTQIPAAKRGAPVDLTGKDLDGKPVSLASLRGKPTVVNVWGSWCASCHQEEPYLTAAAKQLGDRVNFLGIDSRDNGTAQAKAYASRYRISYPSIFSPGGQALLAFPGVITPNSIPSTVILDAQGRPAAAINGGVPSTLTLVEIVRQVMHDG
jgi:thiol-disulfide isomerase/thioredoxin